MMLWRCRLLPIRNDWSSNDANLTSLNVQTAQAAQAAAAAAARRAEQEAARQVAGWCCGVGRFAGLPVGWRDRS